MSFTGTCHAEELQYLFPVGRSLFPNALPTKRDREIQKALVDLWVNFARTGYVRLVFRIHTIWIWKQNSRFSNLFFSLKEIQRHRLAICPSGSQHRNSLSTTIESERRTTMNHWLQWKRVCTTIELASGARPVPICQPAPGQKMNSELRKSDTRRYVTSIDRFELQK